MFEIASLKKYLDKVDMVSTFCLVILFYVFWPLESLDFSIFTQTLEIWESIFTMKAM